jgi:hypothetical protein
MDSEINSYQPAESATTSKHGFLHKRWLYWLLVVVLVIGVGVVFWFRQLYLMENANSIIQANNQLSMCTI